MTTSDLLKDVAVQFQIVCVGRHVYLPRDQGDQIGRVFAYWVIAYFGHFYENYRNTLKFSATLLPR
jgi:hypothetical protein